MSRNDRSALALVAGLILVLLAAGPAAAQWCTNITYDRGYHRGPATDCGYATQQMCETARRGASGGVYTSPCYAIGGPPAPPPDPEAEAVQRVAPKLRDLLARLSDGSRAGAVLGNGWTALPTATPEQLKATLQRAFDALYETYARDAVQNADYRTDIWVRESLKNELAAIEPGVAGRKAELATRGTQLAVYRAELARYQHANDRLRAATERLDQATAAAQDAAIGWIRATLPPATGAAHWGRWRPTFADQPGPGEVSHAQPISAARAEAVEPSVSVAAEATPVFGPDAKPALPGAIDGRFDAVTRMAEKAQAERGELNAANNYGKTTAEAEIASLRTRLDEDRRIGQNGDLMVRNIDARIANTENSLARVQNDEEVLAKGHAAAVLLNLTWENAKDTAIDTVKQEVTRAVLASGTGRAGFHVDDLEVKEAIENGKANMFGLTDHVLKAQDLADVVKSISALANHTGDYAEAVVRYATASPEQMAQAGRLASEGLDEDTKAIQEASVKASGLREPFGSLWLRFAAGRE